MDIEYHHHQKLDSTQDWAKENFEHFDLSKMHVISATEQSKGRGRFNRHWHSPQNSGLYITFCFLTPKLSFPFSPLSLVTGLAFAELLQKLGLKVELKWPNDLFVDGKKIGGVLIETQEFNDGHVFFVGVGINVNMSAEQLSHIDIPATSIFLETEKNSSLKAIAEPAELTFIKNLKTFLEEGFEPFLKDFEEISFLANKRILFDTGHEQIEAQYCRVRKDGALILKQNGVEKAYISGEIKKWFN